MSASYLVPSRKRRQLSWWDLKREVLVIQVVICFGGMVYRAGFWSAMASNVTNQSRNVLSKKAMVNKEVI